MNHSRLSLPPQRCLRFPIALWCPALFLLLAPALAGAEDPFSVSLLARDSLAGWQHGAEPAGWSIQEGQLSGDQRATPLLSGWTLGNFELRMQWQVEEDGVWHIGLPRAPGGQGLDLYLGEGEGCGALLDGHIVVESGRPVERKAAGHSTVIRRHGETLKLLVDEKPLYEVAIPATWRFGHTLALSQGAGTMNELRLEEPAGAPIFNGQNLDGWWTPGNIESWPVIDGELVCANRRGNYLRTDRQYANYTLSFEFKMRRGGNSGIGIRTAPEGWPSGDGIELQLLDQPPDTPLTRSSMMGMYGNLAPFARADRSEQWNRVVIKTDGYMISAWMNGHLVQHTNTANLPELQHRHLRGWIGIQDHGAWIRVRNVNLLEAPDGLGMRDWYRTRAEHASQLVLDRLMNSERLSRADGIRSGGAVARIDQEGETVIAELTGPGAIVCLEAIEGDGALALYFDGEDAPRLECAASKMNSHLPRIAGVHDPRLTYVGYRRGVRIVHRGGGPAEYRLDYVTFPDATALDSFAPGDHGIASGLLGAMSYRLQGMNGGKHREADPAPRFASDPKAIEPGERVALLSLEDAGIVRWLKLVAEPEVLANDDLWLEVTVDGEPEPALSAPARFLFPGMAEKREWHNFVLLHRGGYTNMLAMPFSAGLILTAVNHGEEVIENVGVSVSVEPATTRTRDDITRRMRLRGVFQPTVANGSTGPLLETTGSGRLVGLIYEHAEEPSTGAGTLTVDGHDRMESTTTDFARLLGGPSEGDLWRPLEGRAGRLAWRYMLMAPVDFRRSLVLSVPPGEPVGGRLALYYMARE